MFKYKYDSYFIWIDVEQSVLNRRVDTRVDEMVKVGLVDEVRQIFMPDADYTKGIRRSIGVPVASYFREEKNIDGDDESKKMILEASISSIKRTKINTFINNNNKLNKKKVVFVMGATGTGKSRLSVDLATHFRGEINNSDKIQVYKGLDIVTNRITHGEKQGVRHYLRGEIEPDSDFTAEDFCLKSIVHIENILKTRCVLIIVGWSNSYILKLVEDPVFMFKYKYDSFFIWIDVEQSVLKRRGNTRVDEMVNAGLVDEVRQIFMPNADYTKGFRRSIGVPEMASYLREEKNIDGDDESKKMILQASISSIKPKMNTFTNNNNKLSKKKVVFIMGATRTGKSRLSVDLATHFRGEIINSDRMQVYKGLDIVTNKITHAEKQGVRHYLLGEIDPDSDFTAEDFFLKSIVYIENILKTQCFQIIVGGSNYYIEKLVEDPVFMFKYKYDCCFIWVDVEQSVLNRRVDRGLM
uniref:ATP binding protein n=1 Tax=Solanum tuberosum TaxID=4113 RepID=M1DRT3_SOLTU